MTNATVIAGILLSSAFLSSCTTTYGKPVQTSPVKVNMENSDFPELGVNVSAEVGDTLVLQSRTSTVPAFEFSSSAMWVGAKFHRLRAEKGEIWKAAYAVNGGHVYCGNAEMDTTLLQQGVWTTVPACLAIIDGKVYAYLGGLVDIDPQQYPIQYREYSLASNSSEDFERRLLYSGISGNVVTLSYREFKGGMARAPFTQDVNFDLSQGRIIGFKGARFEVYGATNTGIEYRLIKNFPDRE